MREKGRNRGEERERKGKGKGIANRGQVKRERKTGGQYGEE